MAIFKGGSGNDTYPGIGDDNSGDDSISGGAGNDTLVGGTGNDVINGGSGNDTVGLGVEVQNGDDTIDGGAGDDNIEGGGGNDTINGGAGDDMVFAGSGNDTVNGGAGDDVLNDAVGDDIVNGGSGNDTIVGGLSGADTMTGGSGADTFRYTTGGLPRDGTVDVITDFKHLVDVFDLIGLALADTGVVNQDVGAFQAAVAAGFFSVGTAVVVQHSGGAAQVYVDMGVDGNFDPVEDLVIHLSADPGNLTGADFLLPDRIGAKISDPPG